MERHATGEVWLGDNLEAMEKMPRGRFRLAYLDPPYNLGRSDSLYADQLDSETWQAELESRLRALHPLMREDGFVAIQIDDREMAYLQLVCDGVFGRQRRLNTIVVKMSELSGVKMSHTSHRLPKIKEYILLYAMGPNAR